jgi:hypothetical protein
MARHKQTYTGERLTARVAVMMTPSEREALEKGAAGQGAPTLSAYARDLLFRRSAGVAAASRRNPDAPGIMRALASAGRELNANGNNLNQIADQLKAAISRVLEL